MRSIQDICRECDTTIEEIRALLDAPSALAPSESAGPLPVVGSGGVVVRPLHILFSNYCAVGWTHDAEWAERWASQLESRSVIRNVPEIRPHNDAGQPRPANGES